MRYVLLDSHAILHRAYHALPDFSTSTGIPTGALYGVMLMILNGLEQLKPDYIIAAYDLPQKTHRHEVYEAYKAGRKKTDEALVEQIKLSRNIFEAFNIPIYDAPGFEADDVLGTLIEQIKEKCDNKDLEIIIASGDMDTMQLIDDHIVSVFTLKKGLNDTILYNKEAVLKRFGFPPELIPDYKGLRGDPSDNIIGIKGIGEKTATSLITKFGSVENIYKALETEKDEVFDAIGVKERIRKLLVDNKEEAEFSKVLATIRRDAPIQFVKPEKTFAENLDLPKIESLCQQFEFRSLIPRLRNKFGTETKEERIQNQEVIDPIELAQVTVAYWLLDSNKSNPSQEDITTFTSEGTFAAAKKRIFEMMPKSVLKVYEEIEKPLVPVVLEMNKRGIKVNTKYLNELLEEYTKKRGEIEKKIHEAAGEEFNVSSPKQLSVILFDKLKVATGRLKKTGTGQVSTRESELTKLVDAHPIISLVLEYRELDKLISTYLEVIPQKVDDDSRLHTTFLQAGTTTGRMSCESPNLQNIPIKTKQGQQIRKAFIASTGYKLISLDYSQIELRIAAFLSKDEKMLNIFRSGEDFHTAVAARVFNVDEKDVTKEMRGKAKVINFGIMYGMGVTALKDNLKTDRATAQEYLSSYFTVFSGLASYLESVKAFAKEHGYTETFFGRRRHLEGIRSKVPFVQAAAERMAINAPIQGTEADIVKLAMVKIDEYVKQHTKPGDVYVLLQVHDEIVYEVKEELVEKLSKEFKKIMEEIIDPKDISGITCVAEASSGDNWGDI